MAEWRAFMLDNPYQGLNDWMQHIGAENKQGNISKDEAVQIAEAGEPEGVRGPLQNR